MKVRKEDKLLLVDGYDIQADRFDCDDGNTYSHLDFDEFILSKEDMEDLINRVRFFAGE